MSAGIAPYVTLLRLPFQFLLSPIFLWGYLLAGGKADGRLLVAYLAFHLFLYAGGTAYNSYYDRDEGPVGGLASPPPNPAHLLVFSLAWQLAGFLLSLAVNPTVAAIYAVMFWMSVAYSHPAVRLKGKALAALATIMIGQGVLPYYAGWATARGGLEGGLTWEPLLAGLAATLITGGMYPLTQIYQLDADATRGDLTAARFLGVTNSFRLAAACIVVGGLGTVYVAAARFSAIEAGLLAVFVAALLYAIRRWRAKFSGQSVMENFRTLMRLYAGVTLPFLGWIAVHLILQS